MAEWSQASGRLQVAIKTPARVSSSASGVGLLHSNYLTRNAMKHRATC